MDNTVKEMQARLRLFRSTNIGAVGFHIFINHYGSAVAAVAALPKIYRGKEITLIPQTLIAQEWQQLEELGGRFLFYGQDDYPKMLMGLPNSPPVLSVLGNADLLHRPCVAIVGARNASLNGEKIAQMLANDLGEAGYSIVTGFARGIDSAAHRAALLFASAIGVFAGGVDHVYPPQNQELYQETLQYGAIVSEMKLGYKPLASSFPLRNRIIAGLSRAVVIVEATEKSGSLITARWAEKYHRILCALPGSPLDARAQGGNRLIQQGAHLIENAAQIIERLDHTEGLAEGGDFEMFDYSPELNFEGDNLEDLMATVLQSLSPAPVSVDDIIRHSDAPAGNVNAVLLLLELAGKIARLPGNQVMRLL